MVRKSLLLLLNVSGFRLLVILYSIIVLIIGSIGGIFLSSGIPLIDLINETEELLNPKPKSTPTSTSGLILSAIGAFFGYEAHMIGTRGIMPGTQLCNAVGAVFGFSITSGMYGNGIVDYAIIFIKYIGQSRGGG